MLAPHSLSATVLPGVTVKTHAIIAAGSVIFKDAEPYMIYVGNPAVAVKERVVRREVMVNKKQRHLTGMHRIHRI